MMRRLLCLLVLLGNAAAQPAGQPFAADALPPVGAPAKAAARGKLTVTFPGAAAFRPGTLRAGIARQIESIEEYGLDAASAYDAAFFLDSFYRRHGYAHGETTPTIVGPWELRLDVDEGPRVRVGAVAFEGNAGFPTSTLTDYFLGPIREHNPRIRRDTRLPFVESDIFQGADLVRRLYAADGYLDVEIDPPDITFNADRTSAAVLLRIREGPQYRFGTIRFPGSLAVPEKELLKVIQDQTKGIYTENRLASAQRALEEFYERRGYFAVQVQAEGNLAEADGGRVPVVFRITSGAVHHFSGVTVQGTEGVRPAFIERRLKPLEGKPYDPKEVDRAFRELIQTGLFHNLRITPEAVGGDVVRLAVSVDESKPKEFGVGLGYASFFGGIFSASYRDLNFFGSGRPFGINAEVNQRGFNGEVVYTDPWLFDTDTQLRLRLYGANAILRGYTKNEFGFRPTLSRWLTKHWSLSAFVQAKYVAVRDIDIEPADLVGRTSYSVASIGFSQTFDLRNSPVLPTRGMLFTTSVEWAPNGVGEVAFFRGLGALTFYIPLTTKSTLSLGARAGVITPLNGKGLPIDERFFNGGATTVRSFSELTLGPRDRAGYPLGGQWFSVFNVEYNFPLIGDLYGAVFVDAGNVIAEAGDLGLDDLRFAVGAGLRYQLPIGSIRLDYGLNPSPRQGEAQGAFQFAIGVAF